MKVTELNIKQMLELKINLLSAINEAKGEGTSYDELSRVDELISDDRLFEEYEGVNFTDDDFFCTAHIETIE